MRLNHSAPRPGGYREVLRVAFPLVLSMGTFTVMQFCDRIFLARYSGVSIQAALPAGILSFTLICFFQALAGYAGTFVAQYHGAGQPEGGVRATAQGIWFSLLSWPVIILLIPVGLWLMRISGHAPDVLREEFRYFWILMAGGVVVPLSAALGGFFTGRGRMTANTISNIAGCAANIALDYSMIFGHWGFPEMGITGAAVATVIAGAIPPAALLVVFMRDPDARRMGWRRAFAVDWPLMRRMIRYGLPAGTQMVADLGAFSLFILLTGRLDAASFAASNIGFSINSVAFTPLLAVSIAASILVGQHQGRGDSDAAARTGWTALRVAWCYMLAAGATFLLFPEGYYRLFQSRESTYTVEQLVAIGRPMMLMMAAWGMFDTVSIVMSGALKGAGDTRFVMAYMMAMGWAVWIPGELLILWRGGGIIAAWLWMTAYVLILAVGFWWRWQSGRWKTIDLIEREVPPVPTRPGAEGLAISD